MAGVEMQQRQAGRDAGNRIGRHFVRAIGDMGIGGFRHELVERRLDDELSSRHDQRAAPETAPDHAGSPNAARASAGVASPRPKLRAMSATRATCSAFVGSSPVGSGRYQGWYWPSPPR